MIWTRERYIAHCNFEFTGREMFSELFGPLLPLEEEWRRQGASEKEIAMTAFDWDYVLRAGIPVTTGALTDITPRVISDTPDETISIDHMGRTMKLIKRSATIPLPMDHPVETMDDWMKIRHLYAFDERRINKEALLDRRKLWEKGYLTVFGVPGGFDEPRQLLGEEGLCIAYYEEPEMIADMLEVMADTAEKVMERVADVVPIDNLCIHEDMAGKSGPLIGPSLVREFLKPYYNRVWNAAKACGAKIFSQDSDGNMDAVIDAFLECGVTCFYPYEPAAGMDMVKSRREYGKRFTIKGGIDKHALRRDFTAIEAELSYKITDVTKGGGTIFALDHRIPNGVPIENYRYYVNLGREMLGLGPISEEGWGRMAF